MDTQTPQEAYGGNSQSRNGAPLQSGRIATGHAVELVARIDDTTYHGQHLAAVLAMVRAGESVAPDEESVELGAE